MSGRPFRFGVNAGQIPSATAWIDSARRLESLGYSTLCVPDTMGFTLSPLPALALAAGATSTLRVGTYVLANDFRNPLLVAREAATLDFLSDGRFELGLGLGRPGAESDNHQLGIPSDSIGVRGDRLAEAVNILKRLFRGEKVSATSGHYAIEDAQLFPMPVQQPWPPILIAGGGRRGLRRAAREADIVTISVHATASAVELSERIDWIRDGAGPRLPELELNVMVTVLPDGAEAEPVRQAAHRMAQWSGADLDAALHSEETTPLLLTGSPDRMAEQLLDVRDRYGITYCNVGVFAAEAMAPVVERLAGR